MSTQSRPCRAKLGYIVNIIVPRLSFQRSDFSDVCRLCNLSEFSTMHRARQQANIPTPLVMDSLMNTRKHHCQQTLVCPLTTCLSRGTA